MTVICSGAAAVAAVQHPAVVSANAADETPQLVPSTAVPRPHADAIASVGRWTVVGGLFDTVSQGGTTYDGLSGIVAFDTLSGEVDPDFDPLIEGGQIWGVEIEQATGSVFVAGDFTTVNGVERRGLVKLSLDTGDALPGFNPYFSTGRVNDVLLTTLAGRARLLVAGGMKGKLESVDPATGRNDGYVDTVVADPIPGAWGTLSVYRIAVDPSGTHLAATGNFQTVDGQTRRHFFMLDLENGPGQLLPVGTPGTTLSDWHYPGFDKDCSSTAPRRVAYLQGVDWSPDGSHFTVAATGQIPKSRSDIWYSRLGDANLPNTTVCDAFGRFALADDTKPQWINYTGGDSVWVVADTGAAVYAQGHFKYVDNPDGFASIGIGDRATCPTYDPKTQLGGCATRRAGLAAVDPDTGLAIDTWRPAVPTRTGGKAITATPTGIWFGADSDSFGSEQHFGVAFAPLR